MTLKMAVLNMKSANSELLVSGKKHLKNVQ